MSKSENKLKKINKYKIGNLVLFFLIVFLVNLIWNNFFSVNKVLLKDKKWPGYTSLVIVEYLDEYNEKNIVMYEPIEAKKQSLDGNWKWFFLGHDSVLFYGFNKNDLIKQNLFLASRTKLKLSNISNFPGRIVDIDMDPSENFFLVSGLLDIKDEKIDSNEYNENGKFYCVTTVSIVKSGNNNSQCVTLENIMSTGVSTSSQNLFAFWNSDRGAELIIADYTNHKLFSYDVIDKILLELEESENIFLREVPLNQQLPTKPASFRDRYSIKRIGSVLVVLDKNDISNEKKYFWIGFNSIIEWISDRNIIVVNKKKSFILDIVSKDKSEFVNFDKKLNIIAVYTYFKP